MARAHGRYFGWEEPVNAGPGVNSAFDDAGAGYLENEEAGTALLDFGSTRPGGLDLFDIYMSAQTADGFWGPAVLVPELSSPFNDQRPNVRFDGLEIFLLSDRPGGVAFSTSGLLRGRPPATPGRLRSIWAPR